MEVLQENYQVVYGCVFSFAFVMCMSESLQKNEVQGAQNGNVELEQCLYNVCVFWSSVRASPADNVLSTVCVSEKFYGFA